MNSHEQVPRWRVTYQDTPYAYTSPSVLVVEAPTAADAVVTAAARLTERGSGVSLHAVGLAKLLFAEEEVARIQSAFPGCEDDYHARTNIRRIDPFNPPTVGRVIG